jgi:light-regulated signal transduction histidine kinase (bacteriophytochrome)
MTRLIDGLLGFAQAGRMEDDSELVDLNEVTREALALLSEPCKEAKASVEWSSLPTIRGNKSRLTQLVQNLIGNAIKFRGEQAPIVRLNVGLEENTWVFHLVDNGIGIAVEDREVIFSPLKRLNSVNQFEGTGIGLASCRKIVEFHGGKIWVKSSDQEQGSMFCFTLPAVA